MIKSPVTWTIFGVLVCVIAFGVMQANVQNEQAAMLESHSGSRGEYLRHASPVDMFSEEGRAHHKALLGDQTVQEIANSLRAASQPDFSPRDNSSTSPVVEFFYPSRLYSIEDTQ